MMNHKTSIRVLRTRSGRLPDRRALLVYLSGEEHGILERVAARKGRSLSSMARQLLVSALRAEAQGEVSATTGAVHT